MHKIVVLLFCFYSILSSCSQDKQSGIVNIIIYDDFIEPQKTYDSLILDFTQTGWTDSIKITGKPISVPVIIFEIDTLRAELLGLEISKINEVTKSISFENYSENKLNELYVNNIDGKKIPITTLCKVILSQQPYKTDIFIPDPQCFIYKGECVAKVELFCSKKNVKKLEKFATDVMQKYAGNFIIENWRFEIIKNKVINSNEE